MSNQQDQPLTRRPLFVAALVVGVPVVGLGLIFAFYAIWSIIISLYDIGPGTTEFRCDGQLCGHMWEDSNHNEYICIITGASGEPGYSIFPNIHMNPTVGSDDAFVMTKRSGQGRCANFCQFPGLPVTYLKVKREGYTVSPDEIGYYGTVLNQNLNLLHTYWYTTDPDDDSVRRIRSCRHALYSFPDVDDESVPTETAQKSSFRDWEQDACNSIVRIKRWQKMETYDSESDFWEDVNSTGPGGNCVLELPAQSGSSSPTTTPSRQEAYAIGPGTTEFLGENGESLGWIDEEPSLTTGTGCVFPGFPLIHPLKTSSENGGRLLVDLRTAPPLGDCGSGGRPLELTNADARDLPSDPTIPGIQGEAVATEGGGRIDYWYEPASDVLFFCGQPFRPSDDQHGVFGTVSELDDEVPWSQFVDLCDGRPISRTDIELSPPNP